MVEVQKAGPVDRKGVVNGWGVPVTGEWTEEQPKADPITPPDSSDSPDVTAGSNDQPRQPVDIFRLLNGPP